MEIEKEKIGFYHLKYKYQKKYFKGETNQSFSKFGFYIVKDEENNIVEIGSPFEKNIYKNVMRLKLDFQNYIIFISTDNNNLPENHLNLNWVLYPSETRKEFYDETKKTIFNIFDAMNIEQFCEIRRPVKYSIKRLLYGKLDEINIFFEELLNKGDIVKLAEDFINDFVLYKNSFKKNNSNSKIEDYENKIDLWNKDINLFERKFVKILNEKIPFMCNKAVNDYFSDNCEHYLNKERFSYEEIMTKDCKEKINWSIEKDTQTIKLSNPIFTLVYDNVKKVFTLNYLEPSSQNIKMFQINYTSDSLSITINKKYSININEKLLYFGEVKDEMKEGFGLERHTDQISSGSDDKIGFLYYIGNYSSNLLNGLGVLNSTNCLYIGEFVNSKKEGKCEMYLKEGMEIYQGTVKDNVLEEDGKYFYEGEDSKVNSYQGEFKANKPEGKGKITYINGDIFEGQFDQNGYKINAGTYTNTFKNKVRLKFDSNGKEIEKQTIYEY